MGAIEESGIPLEEIESFEVVGGGSRVNCVKIRLAEILKLDMDKLNYGLSTTLNADEAVARGCGLQCAILSNRFSVKPFTIIDVNPFPVKFTWEKVLSSEEKNEEDKMDIINGDDKDKDDMDLDETSSESLVFKRGEEFPIGKRLTFFREKDFAIDAVYDEKVILNHSTLGSFDVKVDAYKEKAVSEEKTSLNKKEKVRLNAIMNINGLVTIRDAHLLELIQEAPPAPSGEKTDKEPEQAPSQNQEGNEKDNSKEDGKKEPENEGNNNGEKKENSVNETPSAPAKRRFKKIGLNVMRNVHAYSQEELNAFIEAEVNMAQQDRIIQETADARNALESYIYEMRDKISDYGVYKEFASEAEKEKINKDLEEAENWLYDEGFDCVKSVYEQRLKDLLADGNKIIFRHDEVQKRSDAEETCKKLINDYKTKLQANDEKFSHIPDEEKLKAKGEVDQCESWLYDMINDQASKNTYEDPVLTSSQIYDRMSAMTKGYASVMNKPKPPPPPPPTPDESKTTTEGENVDGGKDATDKKEQDDMDVEPQGDESTDKKEQDDMDVEPQGDESTDKMETEEK